MTSASIFGLHTPEHNALTGKRALLYSVIGMLNHARGQGVPDTRLKLAVLALRSEEIGILSDEDAAVLLADLKLNEA